MRYEFPDDDPKDPYKLTEEEQEVMDKVKSSFVNSEKLQQHVRVLYHKGSMYTIFNSNLLFPWRHSHECRRDTQGSDLPWEKIHRHGISGRSRENYARGLFQ